MLRLKKAPPSLIAEVARRFREQDEKRRGFIERYGHARVPVCTKMGDKWVIAIGSGIYEQTQEDPYGFVNVVHDHALLFFGVRSLEA